MITEVGDYCIAVRKHTDPSRLLKLCYMSRTIRVAFETRLTCEDSDVPTPTDPVVGFDYIMVRVWMN